MHEMELLFLDEPTVGLDPSARRKLLDYLKNKVKTGLTIFYTTHILSEAEYLCNEIAIIDKGKIITVDSPDALKQRFGKEKTIKIHLLKKQPEISSLLTGILDCKINFENGTNIIIHSEQSELVLLKVLKILNDNGIEIEDLSAVPTNLEEIFLKMMEENASNN
jgi:ABC-2 type transport system ATP-binding protein